MTWVHSEQNKRLDDGREEEWQANDDGHCARIYELKQPEEDYTDVETY